MRSHRSRPARALPASDASLPLPRPAATDPAQAGFSPANTSDRTAMRAVALPRLRRIDTSATASVRSNGPLQDSYPKTSARSLARFSPLPCCSSNALAPLYTPTLPDVTDSPSSLYPTVPAPLHPPPHRSNDPPSANGSAHDSDFAPAPFPIPPSSRRARRSHTLSPIHNACPRHRETASALPKTSSPPTRRRSCPAPIVLSP